WEDTYYSSTKNSDYIPGQVSQLVNDTFSSEGLSQEERTVLLGEEKPKVDDLNATENQEKTAKKESKKEEGRIQGKNFLKENPERLFPNKNLQKKIFPEITTQEILPENANPNGEINKVTTGKENTITQREIASTLAVDEGPIKKEKDVKNPLLENREVNFLKVNRKKWVLPSIDLLEPAPKVSIDYEQETQKNLEKVLEDFGVKARVIRVARGPVITRYELAPAPGVKISRIVNLADDIALGLAARDVRIEAPIPGKSAIGIEVPNKNPRPVPLREVVETPEFKNGKAKLRFALGKDIGNQPIVANLAKMPHLLVAGATGSGKSVCITGIINSFLFNATPQELKFLMVDPKMVELSIYNGIPHLLAPVVTDPKKASGALKWVVKEMETRYELFAASGVRDIDRYNQMKAQEEGKDKDSPPALPWIVVIIDELADLMMVAATEVEEAICRLAQMARAAGIHLIIATQRPSVDVITGLIKANIPSRISFAVSSQIDSRTILDSTGAEKLLGRGDMLYSPQGLNKPVRVQGCLITDDEVQRIIDHWKVQGSPEYLDLEKFDSTVQSSNIEGGGVDDELFFEAGHLILTTGMASVSFLQRKLKLGYNRAARLIDLLEDNGVVGGYEGNKPRQVLLTLEEFKERFGSL
ncbi:MAG: DNA translocase FtsK, partial [Desulfitobacterium sp.]|nr:DNA translocase FtsK [Desulfitobacterium sp.]